MVVFNWVPFILFFFALIVTPCFTDNDSRKTPPPPANINTNDNDNSPSPLPSPPSSIPFRPSIVVVVGVLTTMFSITFLLLLYAKHCMRGNGIFYNNDHTGGVPPISTARKNSGIHRTVIESLPIFRFGSLRGQKDGLECAVCLTRFGRTEVLRLLPKCKHAFHVECVDTWLDSHSTCPLCRYRVDPEDILLLEDYSILHHENRLSAVQDPDFDIENQKTKMSTEPECEAIIEHRRVSGRHSSAGERGRTMFLHDPASFRRSFDSSRLKNKGESVAVGCFDRPRKDGLLLAGDKNSDRRFEHRIIVSGGLDQRWSDVQPAELLYLQSELIIGDSRRFSSGSSRPSVRRPDHRHTLGWEHGNRTGDSV